MNNLFDFTAGPAGRCTPPATRQPHSAVNMSARGTILFGLVPDKGCNAWVFL